jgi:hypothetical protein
VIAAEKVQVELAIWSYVKVLDQVDEEFKNLPMQVNSLGLWVLVSGMPNDIASPTKKNTGKVVD